MLASNFNPETQQGLDDLQEPIDEIVLLGFSRGAFTARAIASFISDVGLLTNIGMESFYGIFGDWMNQDVPARESKWFQETYGKKIKFTDPDYRETLMSVRKALVLNRQTVADLLLALGRIDKMGNENPGHWCVGHSWYAEAKVFAKTDV